MGALSLSAIVLVLLGAIPGETTGWGTGSVRFNAYVSTSEHQEIYPVGAGQYTVEVTISQIVDDPAGVLDYITKVDVCYDARLGLVAGEIVEVWGTYYDGACPLPYCERVKAWAVNKLSSWEEPESPEEEESPELHAPSVLTGSAEVAGTTATLQAVLTDDGGVSCRVRFVYGPAWHTEWIDSLNSQSSISQKVAGLVPGTRYYFYAEAESSVGQSTGRQGSFVTPQEKVPPIAHPAVWLAAPDQSDSATIAMTADVERDLFGPQEYFFDFVASPTGGAGGSDSPWQFSPSYADLGLNPNHQYGYRVKARDGHGNETAYAPIAYAYTGIETPAGVTSGAITTSSIQVKSSSVLSGLTRGKSGLKLENVTTGDVSAWQQTNDFWTNDKLLPNTAYTFRARARNGDGDLTPFSVEARVYTLALVPTVPVVSEATVGQLFVLWAANGNPEGTQYQCQNTTQGTSSAWMTGGMQWLDTGLSPNVQYAYRVKARNGDGVETAFSAAVSGYTALETPTGIAIGTMTPNTIQVRSQNTPAGLERGESGLWFENVVTGQTSLWRRDNSLWTSDGLGPNHRYGFRVRGRNGDGVPTPVSETAYVWTPANAPTRAVFTGITGTSVQVQWGTNGNPSGTLYLCENTTAGTNSGWIVGAAWADGGLMPNTSYTYRVKARNADGLETAWTALGTQSTDYRSLTISSTPGGTVSTPAQSAAVRPGATVDLVATPLVRYHFLCWTGSAVDAGRVVNPAAARTTVVVDAHYTLVANFIRTQVYVDKRAVGSNNGSSWTNAYTALQDALDAAQAGNEIRVAQGIYKPDAGQLVLLGDRAATFEIKTGVAVKGGYAGLGRPDPNARDIALYETVLSGDLKGDDGPVSQAFDLYSGLQRADNSLHVVSAWNTDSATLLEGVTITAGNSIDGAGLCLIRSNVVISQCAFRANRAGQLSGDGRAGWGEGACVSCYQSEPVFRGCVFRSNWAGGQGGGLYSVESSPLLTGCLFQDNEAGLQGGALYAQDGTQVCLDCTFHANWSWDGGALYGDDGSASRVTNCRFVGNAAHGSGGVVFAAGLSLEMTNCLLSGNLAFADGGGAVLARGAGLWTNCTFNRNIAEGKPSGQALAVRETTAVLTNCILWDHVGNPQAQISVTGTSQNRAEVIVSHCDVLAGAAGVLRNGTTTVTWGVGNLNADPRFQNPDGPDHVAGTSDDDLRLKAGSPCIDAGDNIAVPADLDDLDADGNRLERLPFDLDAHARFADDPATANTGLADAPLYPWIVDLGAYEFGKP